MGEEVSQFLVRPMSNDIKDKLKSFLENVQLFYVEAALQIKQRFRIADEILKALIFLNPDTINSTLATEVFTLAKKFPNIIPSYTK